MASQASLSLAQSLYVAYYGRPADPEGLEFWATVLDDKNVDIKVMLTDFGNSPEYINRFGNLTNEQLVNNLYQQMFGRSAEPEGRDFWVGVLARGERSLAEIADSIRSLASPNDKQVLDARVKLADAFTEQLDTSAELQAYGTDRGLNIGRDYLNQVTSANAANPPLDQVIDVVATLLPTSGGGTPPGGGGGVTPPPAKTLVLTTTAGELTFTGTATGDITVTEAAGVLTFTREGVTATQSKASFDALAAVNTGTSKLSIPAELISGKSVIGNGTLEILGATQATDLSLLGSGLNVFVTTDGDIDLTSLELPVTQGYTVTISAGDVLTLSVSQKLNVTLDGAGSYALKDSAEELAALLANSPGEIGDASAVTVTDTVSLADLAALKQVQDEVSYTTVSGTVAELEADIGGFLKDGINVVVTDPAVSIADLADLADVQILIGAGTITASNIEDSIANLVSGSPAVASPYINAGANITVTNPVTVEQIAAVDAANGDGELIYDITDSLVALLAADPALVEGAASLTLTGGLTLGTVSVEQLNTVLAWSNLIGFDDYDDLAYSLVDTAANLLSLGDDELQHATAVTASGQSSIGQGSDLYKLYPDAVYSITASASALANPGNADLKAAVDNAVNLTASSPATVVQAQAIVAHTNSGATVYDLQDSYSNLSGAGAVANGAHNITVNNFSILSQAEAQTIVNFTNNGTTALGEVRDTAANINLFIGANPWASASVTYTFSVQDSAANIIAALGNLDFVTGDSLEGDHSVSQVYVTTSFTTATAKQFWEAVNPAFLSAGSTTAEKTQYSVIDSIANYILDEQPGGANTASAITTWVRDADFKTVTGSAADINLAQNQGRLIFGELDGNDSIQASGSAGDQLLYGSAGSDNLDGGADNDTIYGGRGSDTITGGTGYNYLHGGDGRDTIFAGASAANTDSARLNDNNYNRVVGGKDGDNMFGSINKDIFIFEARNGLDLIAETGNTASTRDYITNFSQGDRITFADNAKLQFLGNGSTNASSVNAGDFGLSIRYDKVDNAQLWGTSATGQATRVSIDIAKADGTFDNLADAVIILVGSNIDISVEGNSIFYGA